jgi:hypothetical protein
VANNEASISMKHFFYEIFRAVKKIGNLFLSKGELARRAVLRSTAREQKEMEAERLDRLRNPQDYRGR